MENMKCTKECIKSSFSKNTIRLTIPWGLFMLLLSVLLFINMIKVSFETGIDFIRLLFSVLLAVGFPLLILHVLKIRYYIICDSNLKYYSLFHPFGKTLYFDNYIGKIILTEKGSQGSYSVIYLVDKKSKTAFKIVGLHYKKFGEIINAIPLRKMDYSPTTSQYFKLVYFERIKITETGSNPDNDRSVNKALNAIQVFAVIGVGLFVLGMIIKLIAKLGG